MPIRVWTLALSLCFNLWSAGAAAQVLPTGVKGIQLGMTKAQVAARLGSLTENNAEPGELHCKPSMSPHLPQEDCVAVVMGMTYVSQALDSMDFRFQEDGLQSINLHFVEQKPLPALSHQAAAVIFELDAFVTPEPFVVTEHNSRTVQWRDKTSILSVSRFDDVSVTILGYDTLQFHNAVVRARRGTEAKKPDL